ncbi:MAG: hypothetical protein ACXW0F_10715 [Gaiellaceae bacterium]
MQSQAELRERHRGPVITSGDRGFDEARATFNGMIERHPELIVRPIDLADVVTAVLFAREADLRSQSVEADTASQVIASATGVSSSICA